MPVFLPNATMSGKGKGLSIMAAKANHALQLIAIGSDRLRVGSAMSGAAIGIICKAPEARPSKTRLAKAVGAVVASELSACFLRDVAAADRGGTGGARQARLWRLCADGAEAS